MGRERHLGSLLVAPVNDLHALAVKRELDARDVTCVILDAADFPRNVGLAFGHANPGSHLRLSIGSTKLSWHLDDRTSVWWRRPRRHDVREAFTHPGIASVAVAECREAFIGSLTHCCPHFINPVRSRDHAPTKLYQLKLAADAGLRVPKTLVTNEVSEALNFVDHVGGSCIYKFLAAPGFAFYETRIFSKAADADELWRIRNCPLLMQERIVGPADLRATIVGEQVFCAHIELPDSLDEVDGRMGRHPMRSFQLSDASVRQLLKLASSLGLVYCTVDLRLTPDGEIVFFEVNQDGQYLWTEIEADLPISAAMAELLMRSLEGVPQPRLHEQRNRSV